MSRRRPRLITELVTLARSWGWTLPDLARELQVSLASLNQYRSGRRHLSMAVYARIAEMFGEHRIIRDSAWEYARTFHAKAPASVEMDVDLPMNVTRALATFVERFPETAVRGGKGLSLVGADARTLAAAANAVQTAFAAAQIGVLVVRADRPIAPSQRAEALAVPLLIVERVDFLCADVAALLRRRDEIIRPVVVTSVAPIEKATSDPELLRIFRHRTRVLAIDGASTRAEPTLTSSPLAIHAAA